MSAFDRETYKPGSRVQGVGLAARYGMGTVLDRPTTLDGHQWVEWSAEAFGGEGTLLMDLDLVAPAPVDTGRWEREDQHDSTWWNIHDGAIALQRAEDGRFFLVDEYSTLVTAEDLEAAARIIRSYDA